jgi:hypothetical protein
MKYWIGTRGVGVVTTSNVCKVNFTLEQAMKAQRERERV